MRIDLVNEEGIEFDNGNKIRYQHEQDCCENNYADFEQLEESALGVEFNEDLTFEEVPWAGFRFGSVGTPMFFVPCYSEQNGYYSSSITIIYDRLVLWADCMKY